METTQMSKVAIASTAAVAAFTFCQSPGSGFVAAGAGQQQAPTAAISSTAALRGVAFDESTASVGGSGATVAAFGIATAAGAAIMTRNKRAGVQRQWRKEVTKKHVPPALGTPMRNTLVLEWQVDPKEPVPGSEAMCQTMNGFDVEIGGGKPWDPFGFSKLYDRNFDFNSVMVYPHVQWHREAEIKHGRICMLAFVGMVVQQWWQIPGYPQEPDWTAALDLCYQDPLARLGMGQISVFAMLVEGRWACVDAWIGQMDREPGDLGFDPLNITKSAGYDFQRRQLSEIKNGRLAMIGVLSMASNHWTPGSVPFLTGAF